MPLAAVRLDIGVRGLVVPSRQLGLHGANDAHGRRAGWAPWRTDFVDYSARVDASRFFGLNVVVTGGREHHAGMAHLSIDDEFVTLVLSPGERVEAFHGDVKVPRSSLVGARQVPDGLNEVHGIRAPGTALPGAVMVGTWRAAGSTTFAACHGRRPAVVLDLAGQPYDRLVVTAEDPEDTLKRLE